MVGLLAHGIIDPADHSVFQAVFGMIFTVLIALEFNHSILGVVKRRENIVQARTVVLIALLSLGRKFIILDASTADPLTILGLAASVLALGAVYWLVRDQDRKIPPRIASKAEDTSEKSEAAALVRTSGGKCRTDQSGGSHLEEEAMTRTWVKNFLLVAGILAEATLPCAAAVGSSRYWIEPAKVLERRPVTKARISNPRSEVDSRSRSQVPALPRAEDIIPDICTRC